MPPELSARPFAFLWMGSPSSSIQFYVMLLPPLPSPSPQFARLLCARVVGFQHAIKRAGVPAEAVEDVFIGCGIPEGAVR